MLATDADLASSANSGLEYLNYLSKTWLVKSLWQSWSQYGRLEAAKILNKSVNHIAPTTNHLESFNGVLKRKYLRQFQKGGRRIRIDLLVYLLATRILPGIFQQRKVEEEFYLWLSLRFNEQSGGCNLLQERLSLQRSSKAMSSSDKDIKYEFTWWSSDSQSLHQDEALYIITKHRIADFKWIDGFTITATCASSHVDVRIQGHMRYNLMLNCYGWGTCSCPSFHKFGSACKHLWAFRLVVVQMRTRYSFIFPDTEDVACSIYASLFPQGQLISNEPLTSAALPSTNTSAKTLDLPSLQNYAGSVCKEAQEIAEALALPSDQGLGLEEDSGDQTASQGLGLEEDSGDKPASHSEQNVRNILTFIFLRHWLM